MSENEQTLDAEEKRAQLLIDSVPNGILGVDQSGLITLANGTATKLFGYEHAELMGQPVEVLLPKDGRKLFARRKDGSEFPVEIGLTQMARRGHCIRLSTSPIESAPSKR